MMPTPPPGYRPVRFTNVRVIHGSQDTIAVAKLLGARGPMLIRSALAFGFVRGCDVVDDTSGLAFYWAPM